MVSALVRVDARISNVVPQAGCTPSASLLRYTFRGDHFSENQSRSPSGASTSPSRATRSISPFGPR